MITYRCGMFAENTLEGGACGAKIQIMCVT